LCLNFNSSNSSLRPQTLRSAHVSTISFGGATLTNATVFDLSSITNYITVLNENTTYSVVGREEQIGVLAFQEVVEVGLSIKVARALSVTRTVPLGLKQLLQRGHLLGGVLLVFNFLEGELWVEELRVDGVRGFEALANDENFG